MSADNLYYIRLHPKGGYAVVEAFASDTGIFDEQIIPIAKESDIIYGSIEEAEDSIKDSYYEYGGEIHPECYGEDLIIEKEWYLGGDYDCETCGLTANMLLLSVNENKKFWRLDARIGCYGNMSININSPKEERDSFFASLSKFEEFKTDSQESIIGGLAVLEESFKELQAL